MKSLFFAAMTIAIGGCVTLSGNYVISAFDSNGKQLTGNTQFTAQGRGIYTARNALCAANRKASIVIKDMQTGKELQSESPYQCR